VCVCVCVCARARYAHTAQYEGGVLRTERAMYTHTHSLTHSLTHKHTHTKVGGKVDGKGVHVGFAGCLGCEVTGLRGGETKEHEPWEEGVTRSHTAQVPKP
jgi:hypothetical protein